MGNQLVSIAPSQIYPVERYLSELPDLKFDTSLGSTRFLKVARAESQEGLIVVKVFAIHDPTLPLLSYKQRLIDIKAKLASAVNCIPFQKIISQEKAAFLLREYVKYSLYDRLSTRPFLTNIEKRWITFQLLYALHQCHKVGVCHGDIKLENITVTSWNWLLLVDFASFKPTFIPEDNPADYSYFFDTSRRRTCYIAPERFSKAQSGESSSAMIAESTCDFADLTPAMDIFSAGCALLELWNELHVPFEYSHLLAYRSGRYTPQKHLDKLEAPGLRALIASMIQIDPKKRLSAEDYLAQERGKLFPEYFFSFLQSYMLIFSSQPILSPDEKILRLKHDIGNIFKFLGNKKDDSEEEGSDGELDGDASEGLVIITSLVTSCIRGLHDCSSKIYSLEILLEMARHANDDTILDRILPYIMYLSHDQISRVKICAINTITKCLALVKQVPRSNANVFPEYILPGLSLLAVDPNTSVRAAYAQNIAPLAEIALRYLEQIQSDWYDNSGSQPFNYELELQALHEMVQQTVSALLTDSQSLVKQKLMDSGITKLCVFFGKQKAYDVILSHLVTFLNDKEDKELRGSFFDSIIGVAAYIGMHCSPILYPLLLQGLTDSSEFVTVKCIGAMASLAELGLLTKPALCELISESACFLVHPNLWIRHAIVGFIVISANTLSILDVQCKIVPHISVYMKYSLIQIDKPELLLESLHSPIPRSVYDNIVSFNDIDTIFEVLKQKKIFRESVAFGKVPSNTGEAHFLILPIKNLLRRLESNGMTEQVEGYLLNMGPHMKKIHKHKMRADKNHKASDGRIELNLQLSNVKSHVFNLGDSQKTEFMNNRKLHRTNTSGSIDTNINSDWNYSSDVLTRQSESTNSGGPSSRSTTSRPSSPPPELQVPILNTEPSSNVSLHERSYIQYRRSKCYIELSNLKSRQQDLYYEALRNQEWAEQAAWQPQLPPPNWHLRGVLVAHLHEHKAAVNKLCVIPDTPLFASASNDGYVRLWDCSKMEGKNIVNRSKQHYKTANEVGVNAMTVCDGGQSLGMATPDGLIQVLRVDPASNKMKSIHEKHLDQKEDGFATDIQCLDSASQSILVYSTLYGSIVGWDLRCPGTSWRLENGLKQGFITSFCIDRQQSWLALSTRNGSHTVWDLRFQLPITTIDHPSPGARIRKVISHPTEQSWIISSNQGNNEISMWNLETSFREKVLWCSTAPPLSNSKSFQGSSHSVFAMQAGCIDRSPFLLAGGTDQRVRLWDLNTTTKSYLAIPAASDSPTSSQAIQYNSRLIDGTHVTYEEVTEEHKDKNGGAPTAGPEPPAVGHKDSITDIVLCKSSHTFVVTAAKDGIIKVWK